MNILVVEDDRRVADFLERGLRAEGHVVQMARNGPDGLALAQRMHRERHTTDTPTVVILDVMLPGLNGLEVCQSLRAARVGLPILMLTALGSVEDRVTGLKLGADDYLNKPFAFEELLARIDAVARRTHSELLLKVEALQVDDLLLDLTTMRALRGDQPLSLTARELALLELLMRYPGRLFSRERILANVWGTYEDPLTNVVDVYIRRLRSKIDRGQSRTLIHTVRGLGYRLE
jgi:DNA-binding response OmpR family regulator